MHPRSCQKLKNNGQKSKFLQVVVAQTSSKKTLMCVYVVYIH